MIGFLIAGLLSQPPIEDNFVKTNHAVAVQVHAGNSMGSGVVVQTAPNLIVATCAHVIQYAPSISINAPGAGLRASVTRVYVSKTSDLAFLWSQDSWSSALHENWAEIPSESGDPVWALGFGEEDGKALADVTLHARSKKRMSALAFAMGHDKVEGSFIVLPASDGKKSVGQGASGGPLFDRKGNLLGLVAGYLVRKDPQDAVSNFAVVPPATIPIDADFQPAIPVRGASLARYTDFTLPYGSDPAVQKAVKFATRPAPFAQMRCTGACHNDLPSESDAGVPQKHACVDAINHALAALEPDERLDAGVDAACQKQYVTVRAVAVAASEQKWRASALRDYAKQIDAVGTEAQADFSNAITSFDPAVQKSAQSCNGKPCPSFAISLFAKKCEGFGCMKLASLDAKDKQAAWEVFFDDYAKKAKGTSKMKQLTRLPPTELLKAVDVPLVAGARIKAVAEASNTSSPLKSTVSQVAWTDSVFEWTLIPQGARLPGEELAAIAETRQGIVASLASCKEELLTQIAAGLPLACH